MIQWHIQNSGVGGGGGSVMNNGRGARFRANLLQHTHAWPKLIHRQHMCVEGLETDLNG